MSDLSGWIILVAAGLLLIWYFARRRNRGTMKLDVTIGVLSDVNGNLKVLETRLADRLSKKRFHISNYRGFKDRLEFLDPAVTAALNEAFTIAEEFNTKIDIAKKNNNLAVLQDLPLENLRDPLTRSKQGLVVWLKANVQSEMQNNKRRNFLGF
jgi:hypothetical protein